MNRKLIAIIAFAILLASIACSADGLSARDIMNANAVFFADGVGVDRVSGLPCDTIFVDNTNYNITQDRYVNTTEIGEYLSILVLVEQQKVLVPGMTPQSALARIDRVLEQLWQAPNWKGLFYWPYNITKDGKLEAGEGGKVVPVVDNGNLCFALAGVEGAYLDSKDPQKQAICQKIEDIFKRQLPGWQALYDPKRGLMWGGWNPAADTPIAKEYWIDRKANESRLGTIWAILATRNTTQPVPQAAFDNMEFYTADYSMENGEKLKCELTWDGAMFQAFLPAIYVKESRYIKDYYLVSNLAKAQFDYCKRQQLPALLSAAATPDDKYSTYGVLSLAESNVRFTWPPSDKAGAPYATALGYLTDKKQALAQLNSQYVKYPQSVTPFGWYDCIDAAGKTGRKMLSLDQGMLVLALAGDDTSDYVLKYFKAKKMDDALRQVYADFSKVTVK